MAKVIIYLRDHEFTALTDLAQREFRALKAQVIIRRELEKLKLITGEPSLPSNQTDPTSGIPDKPVAEGS